MGKKFFEMSKEEKEAFFDGVPKITKEDKEECGIAPMPLGVDYMDGESHPEEMKKVMNVLAAKFFTAAAVAEARLKAQGKRPD